MSICCASSTRSERRARSAFPAVDASSGIAASSGTSAWPATAAMRSWSPWRSQISSPSASTSVRARSTINSRIRGRSVSLPTAVAISRAVRKVRDRRALVSAAELARGRGARGRPTRLRVSPSEPGTRSQHTCVLALRPMGTIRVIVADDHPVVRSGLRLLLDTRGRHRSHRRSRRYRRDVARGARPQARRARARPQHARDAHLARGAAVGAGALPADRDGRPDDAEGPGVRATFSPGGGAGLRAQGRRGRRAGRGGAPRRRRGDLPQPVARGEARRDTRGARAARRTASQDASSRCSA